MVRGRYDAAQTTDENRRHWAEADYLSADAAASPTVRKIVRSRARYEVANNSIARGIVLTLANDLIGTGPRLQMLTDDANLNRVIEQAFSNWARTVHLASKLRTMRMARATDGEAFAILQTNPNLNSPVKLDLRLVEADRVTTPGYGLLGKQTDGKPGNAVDGIMFDAFGNPATYHVLKNHPGGIVYTTAIGEKDDVPARDMLHWFRTDRPEQRRGLPDIMPALPLFALLRRYTMATLTAAETAAELAIIMKTTAPAGGDAAEVEPWVTMEMARNTIMFSPEGWEPSQMKAEHPGEVFEPFRKAMINEIARCLNMPRNIAMGDSSEYNYASGRLDHQTYFKSNGVERSELEAIAPDRILSAWMSEAILVTDLLPLPARLLGGDLPHQWFWDGHEHVDPRKEASAQDIDLKNTSTTLAAVYAKKGMDWEQELRQRAKEIKMCTELGIPQPKTANAAASVAEIAEEVADALEDR